METSTPTLQALAERVASLERQNRRLKTAGLALLLLPIGAVLMGQAGPSRTVEAEKFVLKDPGGRTRAELSLWDNEPLLAFYDTDGKRTLGLKSTMISLRNGNIEGKTEIRLGIVSKNGPGLEFTDGSGNVRVQISKAGVILTNDSGRATIEISANAPSLHIIDEDGYATSVGRTNLKVQKTGETRRTSAASIALFDNENKQLWSAP